MATPRNEAPATPENYPVVADEILAELELHLSDGTALLARVRSLIATELGRDPWTHQEDPFSREECVVVFSRWPTADRQKLIQYLSEIDG